MQKKENDKAKNSHGTEALCSKPVGAALVLTAPSFQGIVPLESKTFRDRFPRRWLIW
jgi:hypothetical protein